MQASGSITAALDDLQWLRRLAVTLARDADEADDLVQDTLVAAWREPPRDLTRPVRPWLSTVLRNLWRMRRRSGARREQREQAGASASGSITEPERELVRLEVLRMLVLALDRLEPDDRKIIVRRFFDGESAAEIARALAIPAATWGGYLSTWRFGQPEQVVAPWFHIRTDLSGAAWQLDPRWSIVRDIPSGWALPTDG